MTGSEEIEAVAVEEVVVRKKRRRKRKLSRVEKVRRFVGDWVNDHDNITEKVVRYKFVWLAVVVVLVGYLFLRSPAYTEDELCFADISIGRVEYLITLSAVKNYPRNLNTSDYLDSLENVFMDFMRLANKGEFTAASAKLDRLRSGGSGWRTMDEKQAARLRDAHIKLLRFLRKRGVINDKFDHINRPKWFEAWLSKSGGQSYRYGIIERTAYRGALDSDDVEKYVDGEIEDIDQLIRAN